MASSVRKRRQRDQRKERARRSWEAKVRQARRATVRLLPQDRIVLPTDVAWHVLYLRVGWTDRTIGDLTRAGFPVYHPFLLEARPAKGQEEPKENKRPLFARYLFVGLDPLSPRYQTAEQADGVHGFIRFQGRPATVPVEVLQALSDRVTALVAREETQVTLNVPPGGQVRVVGGPFSSFNAIVEEVLDDGRLRVLVDIFGRATPVDVDVADLEAA